MYISPCQLYYTNLSTFLEWKHLQTLHASWSLACAIFFWKNYQWAYSIQLSDEICSHKRTRVGIVELSENSLSQFILNKVQVHANCWTNLNVSPVRIFQFNFRSWYRMRKSSKFNLSKKFIEIGMDAMNGRIT